jgi:hypothetical protein
MWLRILDLPEIDLVEGAEIEPQVDSVAVLRPVHPEKTDSEI